MDRWNQRLILMSNLAILAGLLLVGVQINQNQELTRLQFYHDGISDYLARHEAAMGESPATVLAKADERPGELTTEDLHVLMNTYNHYLEYWYRIKLLGEEGIAAKDRWRWQFVPENDYLVTYFFGNPAGRAWWDLLDMWGDAEFHAAVDAAIQRTAVPQGQHWEPKAWQARIQARLEESAQGP